jgi:lysophospholipase
MNDWPLIPDLVLGNGNNLSGWIIDLPLPDPDGVDVFSTNNQAFYGSLIWSIEAKANKSMCADIFFTGVRSSDLFVVVTRA